MEDYSESISASSSPPDEFDCHFFQGYSGLEYQSLEPLSRGQTLTIRFHCQNDSGSGFLRLTFVRPEHLFDRLAHERNSFYFSFDMSCLDSFQKEIDVNGLSFIGSAGFFSAAVGCKMYTINVKIPQVLSDGKYLLTVTCLDDKEKICAPRKLQKPKVSVHVCQKIRISGGQPLESTRSTSMTKLDGLYLLNKNLKSKVEKKTLMFGRCSLSSQHNRNSIMEAGLTHRFERESLRTTFSETFRDRSFHSSSPRFAEDGLCFTAKDKIRFDIAKKSKIILLGLKCWLMDFGTRFRFH